MRCLIKIHLYSLPIAIICLLNLKSLDKILRKMANARQSLSDERVTIIKLDTKMEAVLAKVDEMSELGDGLTVRDLTKLQREAQNLEDKILGSNLLHEY